MKDKNKLFENLKSELGEEKFEAIKDIVEKMEDDIEFNSGMSYYLANLKQHAERVHKEKNAPMIREKNIQFTLDQVEDILDDMYFDDIPLDYEMPKEEKLKIFNHMPQTLQGHCIMWGANDTEVSAEIGTWILKCQLGFEDWKNWYDSDEYKEYDKTNTPIEIDYTKFYIKDI